MSLNLNATTGETNSEGREIGIDRERKKEKERTRVALDKIAHLITVKGNVSHISCHPAQLLPTLMERWT